MAVRRVIVGLALGWGQIAWAEEPVLTPPVLIGCPDVVAPPLPEGGQAQVLLTIDELGRVGAVAPLGEPSPWLDALLAGAPSCTFIPAKEGELAIPVEIPFAWTFAQPPPNVTGVVKIAGERRPLASVMLRVGTQLVKTDVEGKFSALLAAGEIGIESMDPQWRLGRDVWTVVDGKTLEVELVAIPTGERNEALGKYRVEGQLGQRYIDREVLRQLPGTLGDPVRALANVPGLVRTPFDAGWLLVRGGDLDDTGVFLDGVRVPLLFHLGGLTSILHPELIQDVRLSPGAFSSRYGGAVSGIVDLVPARVEGKTRAIAGVNLAWTQGYVETPLGKGGLALSARRSYLDGVLAVALGEGGASIAPKFWDVQAKWDSKHTGLLLIGLSDGIDAPAAEIGTVLTIKQHAYQLQGRFDADFGHSKVIFRPWMATQGRSVTTDVRTEIETQWFPGGRLSLETKSPWLFTELGVEAERRQYTISREGLARTGWFGHIDPYAQIRMLMPVAKALPLTFDGGVRLETLFANRQFPRRALAPRGQLRWTVNPAWSLAVEAGVVHRAPSPLLLLAYAEGEYLPLQRGRFYGVSTRLSFSDLQIDLDGYRRITDGIAAFETDGSLGSQYGLAYGVENGWRYTPGQWTFNGVAQFSRSFRREEVDLDWQPTRYDQPWLFQLLVSRDLPKEWLVSGRFRYGSGYPYQGTEGTAFDLLTQELQPVLLNDEGRLEPYHALDVKVSKRWAFKNWRLEAYVDVQNTYNRRVPEPVINGIDDTVAVYGFGLPVLPIFGVEGSFWPGKPAGAVTAGPVEYEETERK